MLFTTHPFIPNPDSLCQWINHESLFQDFFRISGLFQDGNFQDFQEFGAFAFLQDGHCRKILTGWNNQVAR